MWAWRRGTECEAAPGGSKGLDAVGGNTGQPKSFPWHTHHRQSHSAPAVSTVAVFGNSAQ